MPPFPAHELADTMAPCIDDVLAAADTGQRDAVLAAAQRVVDEYRDMLRGRDIGWPALDALARLEAAYLLVKDPDRARAAQYVKDVAIECRRDMASRN